MPAEADARREVLGRIGQGLPVVAQPEIDGEIAAQVDAVLHEPGVQPLLQLVAADAEVDRLRVLLHVGQRQLIERRGGGGLERERAEDAPCRARCRYRPRCDGSTLPPKRT